MEIKKISECALCLKEKPLCDSHIIPSFVYKWLKDTSATGYLRSGKSPNLRQQDGLKLKLLCNECESILNEIETLFAKNVFHPYINTELDSTGIATGKIKFFQYNEWLLRFIISLHWRILASEDYTSYDRPLKLIAKLNEIKEDWRQFLLKTKINAGPCESHIVFLQNMISGQGRLPKNLNNKINYYLLRFVDGTIVSSINKISVFSKIGPIAFFTTINPNKLKKTGDSKIKMRGKAKTAQKLSHPLLTNFLFITRPNEIIPKVTFSDIQWNKIEESYNSNLNRSTNSMTWKAFLSDEMLKIRKEHQEKI